ncbi:MAG: 2-phospho-L-lactate transferase [Chloroflexota bacterium]
MHTRVTVLAGGYGGAKLSHGLALASAARRSRGEPSLDLAIVVNTGDDLTVHGLEVSPDLDTVMYTLAGLANHETGWGVRDETWSGAAMFERLGADTWFRLGDRDLATNVLRTERLRAGEPLTAVTAGLGQALGVEARLLPMCDPAVRTQLLTHDGWLDFQEYFVHRHHAVPVTAVRYQGAEATWASPQALDAIAAADLIVLAPSNPFLSIGPILALQGCADALLAAKAPIVAVSPIVGGAALRGPADDLFRSLGGEPSAAGVAAHYQGHHPGLLDALVIDVADADLAGRVEAMGVAAVVEPTVMRVDADRQRLAEAILARWLP